MLTCCANPACGRPFQYLGEGRIFLDRPEDALSLSQEQLYDRCLWLCQRCSELFEIHFQSGEPKLVPLLLRKAANR